MDHNLDACYFAEEGTIEANLNIIIFFIHTKVGGLYYLNINE